jgi:Raf kinase inhibitor-like YbhB/YbcL family protein
MVWHVSAKSFAVTCYDPDAPTGSGFWHWLVVNIPATVGEFAEGAGNTGGKLPAGALQTRTDFGSPGYGGPRPPQGDHPHRYLFTVFAEKIDKLEVKTDTSAKPRRCERFFAQQRDCARPAPLTADARSGGSRTTSLQVRDHCASQRGCNTCSFERRRGVRLCAWFRARTVSSKSCRSEAICRGVCRTILARRDGRE